MSVEQRLRGVFADVFGVEPDSVREADSADTIESWDSVAHLNLVFALEAEFGLQFEAEEIAELVSFRAIQERLTGAGRSAP